MYIICQNNQHLSYFCVILFICKMRAEGICFFLGTKIIILIPDPFFECKTVGRVDIGKFTVNKANDKRLSILITPFRL